MSSPSQWNGQFSHFDLVARTGEQPRTVIRVGNIEIGSGGFVVMAGSCAVESETQMLATAELVAAAGAGILRGGAYKPRFLHIHFRAWVSKVSKS